MRTAAAWILLVILALPATSFSGSCGKTKLKAAQNAAKAALTCHGNAALAGTAVDAACLAAADAAFSNAFLQADTGATCETTGDAPTAATRLGTFVSGVATALRPATTPSACSAAKLREAARAAKRGMRCHLRAEASGTDLAAGCIDPVHEQIVRGFAAAESSGTCQTVDDADLLIAMLDGWMWDTAALLRPIRRVSISSRGRPAARPSTAGFVSCTHATISGDGTTVAFFSNAEDLVDGDVNDNDIFDTLVHDLAAGTTELATLSTDGAQADSDPNPPAALSFDGRYVAFSSRASTLVPPDSNGTNDIVLRDRLLGTTELISRALGGSVGNGRSSGTPALSDDGQLVAFSSVASDLVSGDTNAAEDVFVHDRLTGIIERASLAPGGAEGDGNSLNPSMSRDGRWISFWSIATNLVPGGTPTDYDVFLLDRTTGILEQVNVASDGTPANAGTGIVSAPPVSANGRFVAFSSAASNLIAGDTNGTDDVFVRDRSTGVTERVSIAADGTQANGPSTLASMSSDGRYVAFQSEASNLVPGDTNAVMDVFLADRLAGTIVRVSRDARGVQGNDFSMRPGLSADGREVVFWSKATNLVPRDSNGANDQRGYDIFVRWLPGA